LSGVQDSTITRRQTLKRFLLVSAGVCAAAVGASGILSCIGKKTSHDTSKISQTGIEAGQANDQVVVLANSSTSTDSPSQESPESCSIKVAYFGFLTVQVTGVSEEYLTLPAPVHLQDVLSQICTEHPVLTTMLVMMAITVNGITVSGNPELANETEVDLLPTYAGG